MSKLVAEMEQNFTRVVGARSKQSRIKIVCEALAARFNLPNPQLKMLPPEDGDRALGSVLGSVRNLLSLGSLPLSHKARTGTPLERARDVLPALQNWGVETRAVELLEAAGPTEAELGESAEKEQERRKREDKEARIAADPMVQREIERVAAIPSGFRA